MTDRIELIGEQITHPSERGLYVRVWTRWNGPEWNDIQVVIPTIGIPTWETQPIRPTPTELPVFRQQMIDRILDGYLYERRAFASYRNGTPHLTEAWLSSWLEPDRPWMSFVYWPPAVLEDLRRIEQSLR